jgi:3-hydroxyacyl-CoA dehydrogenase
MTKKNRLLIIAGVCISGAGIAAALAAEAASEVRWEDRSSLPF